ncbi:MarR family winged helix-turn-helix transcriptional regulator [Alsobacter sp. R-9]
MPRCFARMVNMAARAVTRHYNAVLRPSGRSVLQLSLLAAIRLDRWSSLRALSDDLAMERTTLLRNLDILSRDGLVAECDAAGGSRAKRFRLTPAGAAALAEALPLWRKAQDDFAAALPDAGDIGRSLSRLRRAADDLSHRDDTATRSKEPAP